MKIHSMIVILVVITNFILSTLALSLTYDFFYVNNSIEILFNLHEAFLEKGIVVFYFVLLLIWILNLLLVIAWGYSFFFNKPKFLQEQLISTLSNLEDDKRLSAFMISDLKANILWSSLLFKEILNISKPLGRNLINIIKNNNDVALKASHIMFLEESLKNSQSGTIDLQINVVNFDGVLRLFFIKVSNLYVWYTELSKKLYEAGNYLFISSILDECPVAFCSFDTEGKVLYCNSQLAKLLNLPTEMYQGLNITDFLFPLDQNYQISKEDEYTRYKLVDSNNNITNVCTLQHLHYNKREEVTHATMILFPYENEDRITKSNIKSSQELVTYINSVVYDNVLFGIMVIDTQYDILQCNQYLQQMFNIDLTQRAHNLLKILARGDQRVADQLKLSIENQEAEIELEIHLDGEHKLLKAFISPSLGGKIGISVIDLTYNRSLEAQVKLSQGLQTVGQIASAVAHDFNNLLTAIMSFTYFAQEHQEEDDPARVELEHIKQNAQRAKVMIKQLLTFSRKQDLNPVVFDVNADISDLMATIVRLMGEKIEPIFKRGKNVGSIMMDKTQFHQVITNLVINAKDAMSHGGKLEINTSAIKIKSHKTTILDVVPPGNYVVVSVQDQGVGIHLEDLKVIFNDYFSTKGDKGNGLGLSTVRKIVHDSGGFIDLHSKLDQGSTFDLYFPMTDQQLSLEVYKEEIETDLTGSGVILLVEDELPVRMVCKRMLTRKGYTIIEASDGMEALDVLNSGEIEKLDLIISDVMMPQLSGPEMLSKARDIFPNVKSLLISGYTEDILDDIYRDTYMKDIGFLAKPFTPDVLASKVKDIMRG